MTVVLAMLVGAAVMFTIPVASSAATSSPAPLINTVAGGGDGIHLGDGGPATAASLVLPRGVAVDPNGDVYIVDSYHYSVRKVSRSGTITTVAGNGAQGSRGAGDGGPATSASFSGPWDVAVDPAGNLYISDPYDARVRKVDTTGNISTVAGNGTYSSSFALPGDGGLATSAAVTPVGITVDTSGDLYIVDSESGRVRKVDSSGIITTVAGNGTAGFAGDGGPAKMAQLNYPQDVAIHDGNLYISDQENHRVRAVDSSGTISTLAGTGIGVPHNGSVGVGPGLGAGYSGDGGPATAAQLSSPSGLAVDTAGDVFISDSSNGRIRKVDPSGTITTYAGRGPAGAFSGDGGPATEAQLNYPNGLAVDTAGNLFIADNWNNRIRAVGALSVSLSDDKDPVPVGGQVTYTATVGNFSNTAATGVSFTDTLPTSSSLVSAKPSKGTCSAGAGEVSCSLGKLSPGQATTVAITLTAPASPSTMANQATISATHPDRLSLDNADTEATSVVNPTLGLSVNDAPDPTKVGQSYTYTYTVSNLLPGPATGVVLSDTLPPEVSFRRATTPGGTCGSVAGTVTCNVKNLAYGERVTVQVTVRAKKPGLVTNSGTVRANEFPTGTTAAAQTKISHPRCGEVITQSTTLAEDIGPCAGNGLIVGADDITLDLGGHRVFGLPGRGDGHNAGIGLPARSGVTVKNGTVMSFSAGVFVREGKSNTLTGLVVTDNLGPDDPNAELGDGIYVLSSPLNRIVGNVVANNGVFDGIGLYGPKCNGNVIENNRVESTLPPSYQFFGQGIIINAFTDELPQLGLLVHQNRIANNIVRNNAAAGISNFNNADGTVEGNTVERNGLTRGGNGIGIQVGPMASPATNMLVLNNEVHGNAWHGIVDDTATDNRILNNDAADNAVVKAYPLFDLAQIERNNGFLGTVPCGGNVWFGNTWGSGGYSPDCTAAGGSGPAPGGTSQATGSPLPLPLPRRGFFGML